jgi:O-antigen/teichoic acid export membrane protein
MASPAHPAPERRGDRAPRWGSVGGAASAIVDYGVSAVSGLLVNVLLARSLGEHAYGAFAIAFAVWMVIGQLHAAFFAEPMLVLAQGRTDGERHRYLHGVLRLHGVLVLLAAVGVGVGAAACLVLGRPATAGAVAGAALATPALATMQLVRRACYLDQRPARAILVGAAHLVLSAGLLVALQHLNASTPLLAFVVLGGTAMAASLLAWPELGSGGAEPSAREVARLHWSYGAAGTLSSLLNWVPFNVWFLLLPATMAGPAGVAASGAFRAMLQLVQPPLQANGALATFLLPGFARDPALRRGRRTARLVAAVGAPSLLFAGLLWMVGGDIFRLLYGSGIAFDAACLRWLAMVPVAYACGAILRARSMAARAPWPPLVANAVAAGVAALLGPLAISHDGVAGAALAMLATFAVQAATLAVLSYRLPPGPSAAPVAALKDAAS